MNRQQKRTGPGKLNIVNIKEFTAKQTKTMKDQQKDVLKDFTNKKLRPMLNNRILSEEAKEALNMVYDILIKGDVGEKVMLYSGIRRVHEIVMHSISEV